MYVISVMRTCGEHAGETIKMVMNHRIKHGWGDDPGRTSRNNFSVSDI